MALGCAAALTRPSATLSQGERGADAQTNLEMRRMRPRKLLKRGEFRRTNGAPMSEDHLVFRA
jgi:hypothetical protein